MQNRFTMRCPAGNHRLPLRTGQEIYVLNDDLRLQANARSLNAYFGPAVDKLGAYEELGEPEQIKEKLARLDKLEGRGAG